MLFVILSLSHVLLFETLWTVACWASLSFTISLIKLMSIELVMPSNRLILWHPLLFLPSIFLRIRVFSSESVLRIRWPKYWSFSFSISPSNVYSGPISFRIDWFDLLTVQRTLKSLLHHHNSRASILSHSAFFMVQLSHPYMTTGKTIALTIYIDYIWASLVAQTVESACNAGDLGSIPGLGRSPGGGQPLQYSCLENPMDRGAWQATVHGVTKSQT